jgi:hypothetical protein
MRRAGILKAVYNHFALKLQYTNEETKIFVDLHDTACIFFILVTGIAFSLFIFIAHKYKSPCH